MRHLLWLPQGTQLSPDSWARRHRAIRIVLLVHAALLPVASILFGGTPTQALSYFVCMLLVWHVAGIPSVSTTVRSCVAATGLMMASSFLVQLAGGLIEAHFHFFVMVPVVAMYESWLPFGLATGFVLFEHGIVGALIPQSVYGHGAHTNPWLWATVHAVFFAAACVGALVNWRFAEQARGAQETLAEELAFKAGHDTLTGLPNRSQLLEMTAPPDAEWVVLAINLDRFRQVNNALGHERGDQLLVVVARRLRSALRDDDVLVRLGGDDFAAVVRTDPARPTTELAERILACFPGPFMVGGVEVEVDASIGVAAGTDPLPHLLRQAEGALRTAKERRIAIHNYRTADDRALAGQQELSLFAELRRAINQRQLELFFQPKVDVTHHGLVGAEALVRWRHPERGLIPPSEFLPLAENTSLYRPLTSLVLELALDQIEHLTQLGHRLPIAVNVSPRSLLDPGFADEVLDALARRSIDPALLRLEVTETSIMAEPEVAVQILERLARSGLGISIDDFGTGYSSMSMLRELPVDELKVDQSFIRPLRGGTASDAAIVEAMIHLGHIVGMTVIAEGIEAEEEMEMLAALGCDLAQGYLFSQPIPADEFTELVSREGASVPILAGRIPSQTH